MDDIWIDPTSPLYDFYWDSDKCDCLADSDEICPYCKKVMEETA